ncbi:hypothetical protein CHUAL_007564 [Chamberlinius hualienensis]
MLRLLAFYVVCLLLVLMQNCLLINGETLSITTQLGRIKGTVLISDHGQKFAAFRGIRYAKPPISSLRFQPPQAIEDKWIDEYDGTRDGESCSQLDEMANASIPSSMFKGSEDCLFLNIYRPQKFNFEKFPVMVFIHGGAFMSGSGSSSLYGAERFMDKNIVLVTINYRLGPFGFLSTADEVAPGNYGMLDQTLALQWVRHHIIDFGGDPQRVTIFGESAGAASVALHLLSSRSTGLFQAAIVQSGNPLADWGFGYDSPANIAYKLAKNLHCPTTTTRVAIECIKSKNEMDILKAAYSLPNSLDEVEPLFTYRPVVDSVASWPPFLSDHPRQLLLNGIVNDVPVISGINKDEGIMFYLIPLVSGKELHKGNSSVLPKLLSIIYPSLTSDSQRASRAVKHLRAIYFNGVDETDMKKRFSAMNKVFGGDTDTSTDNFNELLANRGRNVYVYKFTHNGNVPSWLSILLEDSLKTVISDLKLVVHGDDLQYMFHCSYFMNQTLTGDDQIVSDKLLTLWTNFATTLNPMTSLNEYESKYRWNAFNPRNPQYLDINLRPKLVNGYLSEDRAFWNSIYQYHYWQGHAKRHHCNHHKH